MALTNWAGNYTYRARSVHAPTSVEQLQEIVSRARRIRALGSRHSFTDIADSAELVSLERLTRDVTVDRAAMTVTFGAGLRYGELVSELVREGLALANLASLPHTSVAGAVATATHGSGDRNGNLATAVSALELVSSDGRLRVVARGASDFEGMVVALGALGVVTAVTLDVQPAFQVAQQVFERVRWDSLFEHFDAITSSGYSVSLFTRWGETVAQVWIKSRAGASSEPSLQELFRALPATEDRHPIPGLDPAGATPQLGVRGLWSERLPHFRMGFTPSSGAEIQSEYIVPRRHAIEALQAVRRLAPVLRPLTLVSEVRTIAADTLWMSPQYRQDTVAIHFTWQPDQPAVERALAPLEAALAPFDARPHWGKLFLATAESIAPLYERHAEFVALLGRLDPRGAFRNRWLETRVLGADPINE
jgi:alditol oxidase